MIQESIFCSIMQNTSGLVQAMARNILLKTGDIVYTEPYILPDTTQNKSVRVNGNVNNSFENNESYLKLYPNPAKDYLTIEYEVPYNVRDAVIEMVSVTGIQKEAIRLKKGWGQKIVDLRTFNPGTYFVRLYINGKVSETKKFVKF